MDKMEPADIDTAVDRSFPSLDYKEALKRPWLKRNYKEEFFIMPVDYLVEHLDFADAVKVKVKQDKKQELKKEAIRQKLDSGTAPEDMPPAMLTLHRRKHEFRVRDGISKISIFRERKIPVINTIVLVDEW